MQSVSRLVETARHPHVEMTSSYREAGRHVSHTPWTKVLGVQWSTFGRRFRQVGFAFSPLFESLSTFPDLVQSKSPG